MKLKHLIVLLLSAFVFVWVFNCQGGNPIPVNTTSGAEDGQPGEEDDCPCDDDDKKCLHLSLKFFKIPHVSGMKTPAFIVYTEKPKPSVFTPQGIHFDYSMTGTKILGIKTTDLPTGIAREVRIKRLDDQNVTYQFADNESMGKPIGVYANLASRMEMVNADGNPVTANPVYYDRHFGNSGIRRYDAATKEQVKIVYPTGRILTENNLPVEVIYDNDNIIRQVNSPNALADIVVVNDYKYEIRYYAPADVGSKDTNGYYTVSGTPFEKYTIENPNASDSDIDDVKVTHNADTSTYITDYQYIEASNTWKTIEGEGMRTDSYTSDPFKKTIREIRNAGNELTWKEVWLFLRMSG